MSTCVIVTGGEPPHPGVRAHLPDDAFVIAADSGLDHAEELGLVAGLIVGDLDSVSKEALQKAREAGIPVEEHDRAKDQTDLELALDAAVSRGATRVVIVSGGGGRLDHLLAGVAVLLAPGARDRSVEVCAWLGPASVTVIHGRAGDGPGGTVIRGRPLELVTLLAIGGPAEGVTTHGLRYPLRGETLLPFSGRGVSNELDDGEATVSVARGHLVVIRPQALEVPA
jgi:thiamine pyrophosphokinase